MTKLTDALDRAQQCQFCGQMAVVTHAADCPDLAFLAGPPSLDRAWREAEAALPEGWGIGIEPGPNGYEAGAGKNVWEVWDSTAHDSIYDALTALAAALRSRP